MVLHPEVSTEAETLEVSSRLPNETVVSAFKNEHSERVSF